MPRARWECAPPRCTLWVSLVLFLLYGCLGIVVCTGLLCIPLHRDLRNALDGPKLQGQE